MYFSTSLSMKSVIKIAPPNSSENRTDPACAGRRAESFDYSFAVYSRRTTEIHIGRRTITVQNRLAATRFAVFYRRTCYAGTHRRKARDGSGGTVLNFKRVCRKNKSSPNYIFHHPDTGSVAT